MKEKNEFCILSKNLIASIEEKLKKWQENLETTNNRFNEELTAENCSEIIDQANKEEIIIRNLLSDYSVDITFFVKNETTKPFKKIIGVSSGKGGVGKSTIALHIAYALKEMGYKVGILDADIYAPSIPVFLNVHENPISIDGRLIEPIQTPQGFQLLSMGLFLQENQAAMWRGPMLASAFTQFLEQSNWDCDYLVIDFPPGTSDTNLDYPVTLM